MSSTNFTFEIISAAGVTDTMLKESATMFSSAYGVWGPLAAQKMGKFFKMSVDRLREQSLAPGSNSVLVRGLAGDKLAGYAFATRWDYEGRQICWVTQLCVGPEFRRQKLATQILIHLREGEKDRGFGIMSSHPAAILGALRAWGRGIEEVNLNMVKEHAAGIMAASPVTYIKNAVLKGSVFGKGDDTVCCADTGFWVDHTEPLQALATVKDRGVEWPFGDLSEGCEFLILVKSAEVD
ncbi:hypothetical protein DM02DRAFT_586383 [Periconia macrospinosa]|uniref:N-acetyltransferase domain-containing protein n=1 Tax=Periconia macrospinosa TaxID=97972 RepID=A0A2V1E1F4_9PLEO|nr:hypothetical protein DM02DRAFT_586383 [Periconia macrospinosa]